MIIAVLGRRDLPTDAVEDYSRLLGCVFTDRGIRFALERVAWDEGWLGALMSLWRGSVDWKGDWALVQYTALAWSRRGFPLLFPLVLWVLKLRGARTVVVFHDSKPYPGRRLIDRVRQVCQCMVMRCAYRSTEATILTIPLEHVPWLPSQHSRANFIPVCPTLPVVGASKHSPRAREEAKTITVLAITASGDINGEISSIALAARRAADRLPHVRLVTVGRGSAQSESKLRDALRGSSVEFGALGVLPAEEVSQVIAGSDVSLFVRSPITTQRSSAMASIANGVPLVAYADADVPTPLAAAGIVCVPFGDREKLAEATVRVLTDPKLWADLHERSRLAYQKYFSRESVASRFLEVLHHA